MAVKQKAETKRKKTKAAGSKSTAFAFDSKPEAREVYLVGDFNNWDPRAHRMTKKKGTFQKSVKLGPGEYQYKFVVDGEWQTDPAAQDQVPNEFGSFNSVVRVSE